MKAYALDRDEAPNKRAAAIDRSIRNTNNKSLYSTQAITRILALHTVLPMHYTGAFYEPSWGTTGVSVKVGDPQIINKKKLREYETLLEAEGFTKRVTPQGVLYHIKAGLLP